MPMRVRAFRLCMVIAACALLGVALYYFFNYVVLDIALDNSGVRAGLQASVRAMWLAFACQALLIALLYALVAFRPRAVSREVIVLFGLLQLLEAVLLFTFAGNQWMAVLLVGAAVCVLLGSILWPTRWPPEMPGTSSEPAAPSGYDTTAQQLSAPDLPPPADQVLLPGATKPPR